VSEERTARPKYLRLLTPVAYDEQAHPETLERDRAPEAETGADVIRVLIAEGRSLVRAGYRMLLELDERVEVVGEAASGHWAVVLAANTQPDVVLLDLGLPGLEHPDAAGRIISHPALAGAAVMIMTPSLEDERVIGTLRAGAMGVVTKDADPAELRRAVEALAAGQALFPPLAIRRLISQLPPHALGHQPPAEQLEALTDREREVVALVGVGLTNGEIAERLVISSATAKTHVYRTMTKLNARHRAELVVLAYETGLVLPRTGGKEPSATIRTIAERAGAHEAPRGGDHSLGFRSRIAGTPSRHRVSPG
jgi:DNA-binding NarL/FixJ family response regulator